LCPGDDIQISKDINYGLRLNSKINNEIKKNFIKLNNFIALTESVKIEYKKLGIPNEKVIEIPYGVKRNNLFLKTDKKTLRNKYNINNDTFVFLCVGRNHPKKNYKLFIEIVNHLNKSYFLNYKILIVGKELDSLNINIKKNNLSNNFLLMNEVSNIPNEDLNFPSTHLKELYILSDCFLFPSNLETFGIVLVEAMMAQLPIITTNAPGCRDVIRKNIDGLVFNVGDYKKAADYMKDVILNPNKRKSLIEKSRKRSKTFDIKNIAKLYENLASKNK
jgi:glycosyltransferase involved in cell wall biosynthesis